MPSDAPVVLFGKCAFQNGTADERSRSVARDLDARLLRFAGNAVDIYEQLNRRGGAAREVARQYLRAATSIGANYAEAAAGQTKPDFITRVAVARKECRESLFWLQLIAAKNLLSADVAKAELAEARQLAAILTAIVRKAKETSARA